MTNIRIVAAALAALASTAAAATPARAQAPARPAPQPWDKDVAALRQQLDDQRELIMRLTEMEEQRYQYLLKLIHAMGRPGAAVPPAPPSLQAPAASGPAAGERDAAKGAPGLAGSAARATTGAITGRVEVRGGKAQGPIFVYVENVKAGAVRGRAVEIKQENKAFVPASMAVQKGTRVTFPNMDPVYHNVFSPSASQPFDLGSYRQGDKPGTVTLNKPGVVEVFCNMHSSMRAAVLVVPNGFYVKAAPDGTFRLENVPIGSRRVVAWTQDANPAANSVELTSQGAEATLTLQVEARGPHKKKDRTNYDSYPRQD